MTEPPASDLSASESVARAVREVFERIPDLAALVAVLAVFLLVGALAGRDRTPVFMVVRGWAIATACAIALPLAGFPDLTAWWVVVLVAAALGLLRLRARAPDLDGLLPALAIGAPLVVLALLGPSTYTDSYTHWLPNARWLVDTDRLLAGTLGFGFYSMHPSYPPALALPTYAASRIAGHFAIGAAQALTSVLAVLTVPVLARTLEPAADARRVWLASALALAALVLLNPAVHGFRYWPLVQGMQYWSVVADAPVALCVLLALVIVARGLDLATLAALGVLLGTIKPGGAVLAAVLATAVALAAFVLGRERARLARDAAALLGGALAAVALWAAYRASFQPFGDQFSMAGDRGWRFDLLPALLGSAAEVARSHAPFYALVLVASALAARLVARGRRAAQSPLDILLVVAALAFWGHLASLLLAYAGSGFADWEIQGAHSWQRYAAQLGWPVCTAVLLYCAACAWRRAIAFVPRGAPARPGMPTGARAARLATGVAAVAAVALAYLPTAASAWGNLRHYQRDRAEWRRLAVAALQAVPPRARVALAGDVWSTDFALYSAWADVDASRRPAIAAFTIVVKPADVPRAHAAVERWLVDPGIDCVLLLNVPDVAASLELGAVPDLKRCRGAEGWQALELDRRRVKHLAAATSRAAGG